MISPKLFKPTIVIAVIGGLVALLTGGYVVYQQLGSRESPVVCLQDAKLCPDGSSVGRIPPICEFAACPSEEDYESTKSAPPDRTPYARPAVPGEVAPTTSIRDNEQKAQAFQPLTAAEIQQAMTVLKSDDRVRTSLATSRRVRTISIERHEEDKATLTSVRRANVVLYNYDRNEIISAVVTLGPRPRVDHLTVTSGQEPMSAQGVEEAEKLALADSNVQARLRAAGFPVHKPELVITNIRFHPNAYKDPEHKDPCWINLCIELTFNTRDAVLYDAKAIVNLATGKVDIK